MNVISEKANDDQYLNKTTWAFSGYAEELGRRLTGKLTLMRWGQAIMFYNVNHQYPHASFHLHSLVEKRFTQQGPNELYNILEQAKQLTKEKLWKGGFCWREVSCHLGQPFFRKQHWSINLQEWIQMHKYHLQRMPSNSTTTKNQSSKRFHSICY